MPEMIEKSNIVGIVEIHVYTEVGIINVFLPLLEVFEVYLLEGQPRNLSLFV